MLPQYRELPLNPPDDPYSLSSFTQHGKHCDCEDCMVAAEEAWERKRDDEMCEKG